MRRWLMGTTYTTDEDTVLSEAAGNGVLVR